PGAPRLAAYSPVSVTGRRRDSPGVRAGGSLRTGGMELADGRTVSSGSLSAAQHFVADRSAGEPKRSLRELSAFEDRPDAGDQDRLLLEVAAVGIVGARRCAGAVSGRADSSSRRRGRIRTRAAGRID